METDAGKPKRRNASSNPGHFTYLEAAHQIISRSDNALSKIQMTAPVARQVEAKAFYCARTSPVLTYRLNRHLKCPPPCISRCCFVFLGLGCLSCLFLVCCSWGASELAGWTAPFFLVYVWSGLEVVAFRPRDIERRVFQAGRLK